MAYNSQQPKKNKKILGSLIRNKDKTKPPYITLEAYNAPALISELSKLQKGQKLFLNLTAPRQELLDIEEKVQSGRMSQENYQKIKERLEKIPDFVVFQVSIDVAGAPASNSEQVPF